jgi:hypothetical protein
MAHLVTRLSHHPVDRWVLHGTFSRLEPCAVKIACTVLRGRGGSNATPLPDYPRLALRTSLAGSDGTLGLRGRSRLAVK